MFNINVEKEFWRMAKEFWPEIFNFEVLLKELVKLSLVTAATRVRIQIKACGRTSKVGGIPRLLQFPTPRKTTYTKIRACKDAFIKSKSFICNWSKIIFFKKC